jgi:uncharacterized membrane protein YciS (DUF1049 family)
MDDITTGIMVLLILLGVASPIVVICVVHYLKKRLEHKQILAAIEKGTPLSELMPLKPTPIGPAWIRYVSGGTLMFFIAFGFLLGGMGRPEILVTFVLLGVAVSLIIRGLLYRKYYLKSQSANQNDMPPNKISA